MLYLLGAVILFLGILEFIWVLCKAAREDKSGKSFRLTGISKDSFEDISRQK